MFYKDGNLNGERRDDNHRLDRIFGGHFPTHHHSICMSLMAVFMLSKWEQLLP